MIKGILVIVILLEALFMGYLANRHDRYKKKTESALKYYDDTLHQANTQIAALMPLLNQFEQMKSQLEIDLHMAQTQISLLTQARSGHSIETEMNHINTERYDKMAKVWSQGGMGVVDMDVVTPSPYETQMDFE